ncbi:MAG: hypothetical protein R2748_34390 [Bryobacterales bacterium]
MAVLRLGSRQRLASQAPKRSLASMGISPEAPSASWISIHMTASCSYHWLSTPNSSSNWRLGGGWNPFHEAIGIVRELQVERDRRACGVGRGVEVPAVLDGCRSACRQPSNPGQPSPARARVQT